MKPSRIKAQFEAEGITIKEWAVSNGFNPRTVYAVLQGNLQCKHGISHKIAVALGMKKQPAKTKLNMVA